MWETGTAARRITGTESPRENRPRLHLLAVNPTQPTSPVSSMKSAGNRSTTRQPEAFLGFRRKLNCSTSSTREPD